MQEQISIKFKELFQTEGGFFASPGRINLIGEHTDYNGGFVFPGAVDKGMIAEIKPNGTGTLLNMTNGVRGVVGDVLPHVGYSTLEDVFICCEK